MANTNPLHLPSNVLFEQLRDQMRRMLVRLDEMRQLASQASGAWMPPVDVIEMEEAIMVRAEMPGVALEHARLTVLDNTLKIEGRKERENLTDNLPSEDERPIRFICLERSYGSFAFTVTLRWQVDPAKVTARMSDGVLEIHLPKTNTAGREIQIPITE
ncbi:MAG: Hsp20/alpha crystallin family protein [Blastocatellia bacterium]